MDERDTVNPPPAEPAAEPRTHRTEAEIGAARTRRREARRLAHEGEIDEAWAIFEELIEASPRSPSLRCEGGYVAQRAAEIDAAEEHLEAGLAMLGPPEMVASAVRNTAATCLYNRGRVHEARGEIPDAVRRYRASLRLRENAIVRRRFDALSATVDWSTGQTSVSTMEGLVALLEAHGCGDSATCEGSDDCPEAPGFTTSRQRSDPTAGWIRADCSQMNDDMVYHLMVAYPGDGGLVLAEAATYWLGSRYYQMSDLSSFEAGEVRLIESGGARWLRFDARTVSFSGHEDVEVSPPDDDSEHADVECYSSSSTTVHERFTVLCPLGAPAACRRLTTRRQSETQSSLACGALGADGQYAETPTPAWASASLGATADQDDELELTFGDDGARLRVVDGQAPEALRGVIGRPMPAAELMTHLEELDPVVEMF